MGLGAVSNDQMYVDAAKKSRMIRMDLSATWPLTLALYDPLCHIIVDNVRCIHDVAGTANAPNAILMGTSSDDDAVFTFTPDTVASVGNIDTVTLLSTLASTRGDRTQGYPLIPAGTPTYIKHTADSNDGEVTLVIQYYLIDSATIR